MSEKTEKEAGKITRTEQEKEALNSFDEAFSALKKKANDLNNSINKASISDGDKWNLMFACNHAMMFYHMNCLNMLLDGKPLLNDDQRKMLIEPEEAISLIGRFKALYETASKETGADGKR